MKKFSVRTAKKGGKSVKRYSKKQALKVLEWDEIHSYAIEAYFLYCKEQGKDQAFYAADDWDLITQVEDFLHQLTAATISNNFLEIVKIPGVDCQRVTERILDLMNEIRKEQLDLFLADIKEFRDCYSEDQLKNLEAFFNANGLSLN